MKRKLIAMTLTLALAQAMAVPAFAAAEATQVTTAKGTETVVKYEVAEKYTVTIPKDVTFTSDEGGTTKTETVSATEVFIGDGKTLKVTATGANKVEGSEFRMKDAATNYLAYTLTTTDKGAGVAVAAGGTVLSVAAGTNNKEASLTYTLTDTAKKAGTYTDTLTFTVAVEDPSASLPA